MTGWISTTTKEWIQTLTNTRTHTDRQTNKHNDTYYQDKVECPKHRMRTGLSTVEITISFPSWIRSYLSDNLFCLCNIQMHTHSHTHSLTNTLSLSYTHTLTHSYTHKQQVLTSPSWVVVSMTVSTIPFSVLLIPILASFRAIWLKDPSGLLTG